MSSAHKDARRVWYSVLPIVVIVESVTLFPSAERYVVEKHRFRQNRIDGRYTALQARASSDVHEYKLTPRSKWPFIMHHSQD